MTKPETHFEFLELGLRYRIGLRDNGYNINFGVQLLHANQIDWFKAVSSWTNEIEAGMDPCIMVRG